MVAKVVLKALREKWFKSEVRPKSSVPLGREKGVPKGTPFGYFAWIVMRKVSLVSPAVPMVVGPIGAMPVMFPLMKFGFAVGVLRVAFSFSGSLYWFITRMFPVLIACPNRLTALISSLSVTFMPTTLDEIP